MAAALSEDTPSSGLPRGSDGRTSRVLFLALALILLLLVGYLLYMAAGMPGLGAGELMPALPLGERLRR